MIEPIKTIFASNTNNKIKLTESKIANGIQYKGAVVSNELNGIANRADIMIDDLQRTTAFYNNMKQYKKNDLCKLLIKYNGVYGIVALIYNNIMIGNVSPFIENENVVTLKFEYNYKDSVPILTIETDNPFDFALEKLLNSENWDIISMSDNFSQKKKDTFSVAFQQNFSMPYKYRGIFDLELDFSLAECDAIVMYSIEEKRDFTSPLFTKEFLYSIYKNKIQFCFTETVVYLGPNRCWQEGFISLGNFNAWDLKKNKISLFYTWNSTKFIVAGIKN